MGQYTIRRGDTLSGIAAKNGTTVKDLMRLNPQIRDVNKIFTGFDMVIYKNTVCHNADGKTESLQILRNRVKTR